MIRRPDPVVKAPIVRIEVSFLKKAGVLPWVLLAIVLGVIFGQFLNAPISRIFVTFNELFSQFLNFSIPLIIVGLVVPAIADLGKGAGKWLGITTVIAYGALAFTPFPGLRQMAFFAFTGLVAGWLTSLFWLPFLARPLPPLSGPGLWAANSRPFWANLLRGRLGKVLSLLILLILKR